MCVCVCVCVFKKLTTDSLLGERGVGRGEVRLEIPLWACANVISLMLEDIFSLDAASERALKTGLFSLIDRGVIKMLD